MSNSVSNTNVLSAAAMKKEAARQLWAHYWNGRTEEARNALIENYLPLVRFAAIRLSSRHGRRAQATDVDDLLQFGAFGLSDAIRGFDPTRGVKFETYCLQRIRGAMLDGLKANQWMPRELRQRVNRFNEAREQALTECGNYEYREAVAGKLGVCTDTVHALEQHASNLAISGFRSDDSRQCAHESSDETRVADHREELPFEAAQREDVRELMMRELTRTERHLVMLYYYEELTMREVGDVLGISGTRVSQIHTDIMTRLRDRLADRVSTFKGIPLSASHL